MPRIDTVMGVPTIEGMAAAAARAEELGFDGLMTAEASHEPFLPLMVAAEHSSRLDLLTGIAVAFP